MKNILQTSINHDRKFTLILGETKKGRSRGLFIEHVSLEATFGDFNRRTEKVEQFIATLEDHMLGEPHLTKVNIQMALANVA